MKLNLEQKKSLSNYSGNLSIAWFAAGVIGPIVTKQNLEGAEAIMILSIFATAIYLMFMLRLLRKGSKK